MSTPKAAPAAADRLDEIQRVARGDRAALRALYDAYASGVLAVAVALLRDRTEAEDVTQECFIEVWRRASDFDPARGSLGAWIGAIGRSRAIDRLRSRDARGRAAAAAGQEPAGPAPAPPLELASARQERELVLAALDTLPEEQRRVVDLAYYQGLSQREIAEREGEPLGTVKTRVRLAMQKLAENLGGDQEGVMTCDEFKAEVDAWVLGSLDATEGAAFEAHLATQPHDGCVEALARARETVSTLTATLPPQTPEPRVWRSIEAAITEQRHAPPVEPRSRRVPWGWLLAAAAALVALGTVAWKQRTRADAAELAFRAEQKSHREVADLLVKTKAAYKAALDASRERESGLHKDVDALKAAGRLDRDVLAMLEDPETRIVAFKPAGGSKFTASALVNTHSGHAMVISSALPEKAGSTFELWIIRGGNPPHPAGFLTSRADGSAVGEIDRKLLAEGTPDALAVSVEPAGGKPTPTQVILTASLEG